jgi:hypothetical protein
LGAGRIHGRRQWREALLRHLPHKCDRGLLSLRGGGEAAAGCGGGDVVKGDVKQAALDAVAMAVDAGSETEATQVAWQYM